MEIKSDIRNELFKRNEIEAELESEKNPGFVEVKKMISEQIKKPEEQIDVYNIKGNFGSKLFKISANIYDSVEDLNKAEQKTQKQRKKEKEEAAKAKGEEAKTEEKPAEEEKTEEAPKEEAPAEEKPAEEEKKEEAPAEEEKQGEQESKE